MNIEEYLGGKSQDEKIERIQKIVAFRDVFLENAEDSGSEEARRLAEALSNALLGLHFGYKPCCVVEFCERMYFNRRKRIRLCPRTRFVMCDKCEKELDSGERIRGTL